MKKKKAAEPVVVPEPEAQEVKVTSMRCGACGVHVEITEGTKYLGCLNLEGHTLLDAEGHAIAVVPLSPGT